MMFLYPADIIKKIQNDFTKLHDFAFSEKYGYGKVAEATKVTVSRELNGTYECSFNYPITGKLLTKISGNAIVVCRVSPYGESGSEVIGEDPWQTFRIYSISRPIKGILEIKAQHISYDLTNIICRTINYGGSKNDTTDDSGATSETPDLTKAAVPYFTLLRTEIANAYGSDKVYPIAPDGLGFVVSGDRVIYPCKYEDNIYINGASEGVPYSEAKIESLDDIRKPGTYAYKASEDENEGIYVASWDTEDLGYLNPYDDTKSDEAVAPYIEKWVKKENIGWVGTIVTQKADDTTDPVTEKKTVDALLVYSEDDIVRAGYYILGTKTEYKKIPVSEDNEIYPRVYITKDSSGAISGAVFYITQSEKHTLTMLDTIPEHPSYSDWFGVIADPEKQKYVDVTRIVVRPYAYELVGNTEQIGYLHDFVEPNSVVFKITHETSDVYTANFSKDAFKTSTPKSLKSILEGEYLSAYPKLEFYYDNYGLRIKKTKTSQVSATILYGKNLTDLKRVDDTSENCDALVPFITKNNATSYFEKATDLKILSQSYLRDYFGIQDIITAKDKDLDTKLKEVNEIVGIINDKLIYDKFTTDEYPDGFKYSLAKIEDGNVVLEDPVLKTTNLSYLTDLGFSKTLAVDLSSKVGDNTSGLDLQYELFVKAIEYMLEKKTYRPKIDLTLSYVDLTRVADYKPYASTERIDLGGTIRAIYKAVGVDTIARCTKTEYDVLTNQYTNLTLVDAGQMAESNGLSSKLLPAPGSTTRGKVNIGDRLADIFATEAKKVVGNEGGYVSIEDMDRDGFPDTISIMDTANKATAKNVWLWNKAGLVHFSNGIYDASSANIGIYQNGIINADLIRAGILETIKLQTPDGILKVGEDTSHEVYERESDGSLKKTVWWTRKRHGSAWDLSGSDVFNSNQLFMGYAEYEDPEKVDNQEPYYVYRKERVKISESAVEASFYRLYDFSKSIINQEIAKDSTTTPPTIYYKYEAHDPKKDPDDMKGILYYTGVSDGTYEPKHFYRLTVTGIDQETGERSYTITEIKQDSEKKYPKILTQNPSSFLRIGVDGTVEIAGKIIATSGDIGGNILIDDSLINEKIEAQAASIGKLVSDHVLASTLQVRKKIGDDESYELVHINVPNAAGEKDGVVKIANMYFDADDKTEHAAMFSKDKDALLRMKSGVYLGEDGIDLLAMQKDEDGNDISEGDLGYKIRTRFSFRNSNTNNLSIVGKLDAQSGSAFAGMVADASSAVSAGGLDTSYYVHGLTFSDTGSTHSVYFNEHGITATIKSMSGAGDADYIAGSVISQDYVDDAVGEEIEENALKNLFSNSKISFNE